MASLIQESTQHPHIEPDTVGDGDSAYGEGSESDTTSIASSILNYTYENGRRYSAHGVDQYYLPNDENEADRLDLLHHIFRMTLDGKLCQTKLTNPQRVLDVGTGTGIWAIEMGEEYPSAEIIGTDISLIQPSWVPPNVRFEIDDAGKEWTFSKKFDFIHVRALVGSLDDWPAFLAQCYKHLKPGGHIEIAEVRTWLWCGDDSFPKDSYTNKMQTEFKRLIEKSGKMFDVTPLLSDWLSTAGFIDYAERSETLPVGPWPADKRLKEIGNYFKVQFLEGGLENYVLAMFTHSGWEYTEVQALLAHVRKEVRTNKMHIYTRAVFATAQKPSEPAQVEA
ncbi:hypothetical protein MMC16_001822 [Acarospora aff. strigata]|nr:hypothetical protein [Acarospora aff. strigata]